MSARTFMSAGLRRLGAAMAGGVVGVMVGAGAATATVSDVTSTAAVTPVRVTAGTALAMTAPASGEIWVAERAANGKLLLEHGVRGQWSSKVLPVTAGTTVVVDSSSPDDVWLVASDTLWHFDGRAWRKVTLPAAPLGGRFAAISVRDVAGPDVFVGLSGQYPTGGAVYRLRGTRWTSLGSPEAHSSPRVGADPLRLSVGGGKLFAVWNRFSSGTSYSTHSVYRYDSGRWTKLYTSNVIDHYSTSRLGAWITPTSTSQVALGTASSYGKESGLCLAWAGRNSNVGTMTPCTTSAPVSAADVLSDGRILLGGADYVSTSFRNSATSVTTPGAFAIRAVGGAETTVAGDPGDRTVAVETVPGTSSAWVLTSSKGVTTLQSFAG